MRDEVREDLEAQLENAREAWDVAERMGAELAEHALQSNEELRTLKLLLREIRNLMRSDAQRRMRLEHIIAFQVGVFVYQCASYFDGQGAFNDLHDLKLTAYLLCVAPSLCLYLRNSWHRFQIKHHWDSWRDNDFANELRQIWKERSSH